MPTLIETLETEVLHLCAADRARILERLMASFDDDSALDEAWLDKALHREAEVDAGIVQLVSGYEALARIRVRLV